MDSKALPDKPLPCRSADKMVHLALPSAFGDCRDSEARAFHREFRTAEVLDVFRKA
jgi:hypothetical protein